MTRIVTISDLAADAIAALTDTRWSITDAPAHVPARPGLYAIFGDERAHRELGLLEDAGSAVRRTFRSTLERPRRASWSAI